MTNEILIHLIAAAAALVAAAAIAARLADRRQERRDLEEIDLYLRSLKERGRDA